MSWSRVISLFFVSVILMVGVSYGAIATAQAPPSVTSLPRVQFTDKNGVDLKSGGYAPPLSKISIGPADAPALTFDWMPFFDASLSSGTPMVGYVYEDYCAISQTPCMELAHARLGDRVIDFDWNTDCDCTSQTGDTLSNDAYGNYIVTEADGTVWTFPSSGNDENQRSSAGLIYMGYLSSVKYPDGRTLTYTYNSAGPGPGISVQSIVSNLGYELHRDLLGSVTLINLAQNNCAPTAATCGGYTVNWPVTLFSGTKTTDSLGRITQLTSTTLTSQSFIDTITSPAGIVQNLSFQFIDINQDCTSGTGAPVITKYQNNLGAWTYSYAADTQHCKILTTTEVDPFGHTKVYNYYVGYSSITDELGRTTGYGFSDQQMPNSYYPFETYLTLVNTPVGPQQNLAHDARGNVITATETPSGSGLSPVSATGTYPSTCSNNFTCNHPTATIDPNGHETDYTYDPNTGLVLTKTLPAGQNGVRPQTRYTYQQLSATYYNASGVMAQGSPIWKLVSTSTCQTQTSCSGTSDEVRVIYA